MTTDFANPIYLKGGSSRQRDAYRTLQQYGIMEALKAHGPILAGTVPLGIDLPGSDLDIICEAQDRAGLGRLTEAAFGRLDGYHAYERIVGGIPRFVANFTAGGWPVQIFAQPMPAIKQNGYRHMVIEHRILTVLGDAGAVRIIGLKQSGLKTEPAFAALLGLSGDPYQKLLELEDWDDRQLKAYLDGLQPV